MVGFRSVASTHVKSTNNVLRGMMMVMMDWGSRRDSFGLWRSWKGKASSRTKTKGRADGDTGVRHSGSVVTVTGLVN